VARILLAVVTLTVIAHAVHDPHPFWPVLVALLLLSYPGGTDVQVLRAINRVAGTVLGIFAYWTMDPGRHRTGQSSACSHWRWCGRGSGRRPSRLIVATGRISLADQGVLDPVARRQPLGRCPGRPRPIAPGCGCR
jgi:hypothetical protein